MASDMTNHGKHIIRHSKLPLLKLQAFFYQTLQLSGYGVPCSVHCMALSTHAATALQNL